MNLITDIIYIYVYLVILVFLRFIDLDYDNYLLQKFYIFISIFVFTSLLEVIKKVKNECPSRENYIISNAFSSAVIAVLGFTIYVDLVHMSLTRYSFEYINLSNFYKTLFVPLIIVLTMMTFRLIYLLFDYKSECS